MRNRPSFLPAFILMFAGLLFLLNDLGTLDSLELRPEEMWPGLLVLIGVVLWAWFLFSDNPDNGLAFWGTLTVFLGLFMFLFTLNVELPVSVQKLSEPIDWKHLAYLWPVGLLILGLAFIARALFSGNLNMFLRGLVVILLGVVAFFFTLGSADWLLDMAQLWPLLLILGGGVLLLQRMVQRIP